MLIRDSVSPAQVDPVGCAVVAGDWYSVYDGVTSTDPAELEIDHVVASKRASRHGRAAMIEAITATDASLVMSKITSCEGDSPGTSNSTAAALNPLTIAVISASR